MRTTMLAVAVLLGGPGLALADDATSPSPSGGPAKIIDSAPAPKGDQSPPALSPPSPAVSTKAKATERAAEEPGSHFSFVRVDDGFLRFDLQTGQVAYCNAHAGDWGCQAVPENRSALEREVQGLKEEVASLKRQIETLREPPPPPRPPAPIPPASHAPAAQGDMTRGLPGSAEIARAKTVLRDAWQRFVDAIVGIKNDMMRQS
jgi:hypothetical protein